MTYMITVIAESNLTESINLMSNELFIIQCHTYSIDWSVFQIDIF